MATIKFGALVVGARGTIGGVTYSQNASGPYARNWSRGANPRSNLQSTARQHISVQPDAWRALSDSQRGDWNAYGADPSNEQTNALGEPYFLTGWQWFVRTNARLMRAGRATITDPPTSSTPSIPTIDAWIFEESGGDPLVELEYPSGEYSSSIDIIIEVATVVSGGHTAQYRGWQLLYAGAADGSGSMDLTTEYRAIFGNPEVGWQAFVRIYRQTDDGLRSAPSQTWTYYT